MKYDKEEKAIIDSYEKGNMKVSTPSKKELASIKAKKEDISQEQTNNIRLYDHDYQGIQKKAMEMGIPYQTLISGIIHRYIEGDSPQKRITIGCSGSWQKAATPAEPHG